MKARTLRALGLIACLLASTASAYPITTPFSSFEVLNEQDFFARYSVASLVADLFDRGDGTQPDSWLVRGWYPGIGSFWEDVSFGYERGLASPYPILRPLVGDPNTPQPLLAINTPFSFASAVPFAVYTDQGFLGLVPTGPQDTFFPLYPEPGVAASAVTTIYSIQTVTARAVPEPSALLLLAVGLLAIGAAHRAASHEQIDA